MVCLEGGRGRYVRKRTRSAGRGLGRRRAVGRFEPSTARPRRTTAADDPRAAASRGGMAQTAPVCRYRGHFGARIRRRKRRPSAGRRAAVEASSILIARRAPRSRRLRAVVAAMQPVMSGAARSGAPTEATPAPTNADPASEPIAHAGASEGLKIAGIDPNHITSGSRAAKGPQLRLQICVDGPVFERGNRANRAAWPQHDRNRRQSS